MTSSPTKINQATQWNAADYAANSAIQQIWARELIARFHLRGDEYILDVGCGDGKVTAEIARAVPGGSVTGVDASPQMIAFAQKTFSAKKNPNLHFQVMDARAINATMLLPWERRHPAGETPALPGVSPFDLIFSNAALHWVDDHPAFLRGVSSVLKTGGRLVVSCGGKGNAHDVFLALRPEMRLKQWREFFRKMPMPYFFYAPSDYEKWLPKFGFKINRIKLAPKDATYDGEKGFATWLRTTWIPFVQRVPEHLREEFIAAVTKRYIAKHSLDKEGRVHVRMVRLEIDAVKI